jgi:hypothetical protein
MANEAMVRPGTVGIYFLLCGGTVAYVGQSKDILVRLGQHVSAGVSFDDYRFIKCDAASLDLHEFHYIKQFSPPLNNDGRSKLRRRMRNGERLVKENASQETPTISET